MFETDATQLNILGFGADVVAILADIEARKSHVVSDSGVQTEITSQSYTERLNTDKTFYEREVARLFNNRPQRTKSSAKTLNSAVKRFLPVIPHIIPDTTGIALRIDPEMARLAILFRESYLFRVWGCAQDMTRQASGDGKISKKALLEALRWTYGLSFTDKRFEQWLEEGEDIYWTNTPDFLYLSGRRTLARIFTERALNTHPEAIETNQAGATDMLVQSGDTLAVFEARCYEAWLSYRNNPKIARATLSMLFGRNKKTFIRWEKSLPELEIIRNYQQTIDADIAPVGAEISVTRGNKTLYVKQSANTYRAKTRQHAKRGSARQVRKLSNAILRIENTRRCVPKLYFDDEKRAIAHAKKHEGTIAVFRGFSRYGHGIWELTQDGYCDTRNVSRSSFRHEWAFRQNNFSDYGNYIHSQRELFYA